MIERLEGILKKYNEIKETLSKPETLSNINLLTSLSKEASSLEEVVTIYLDYKNVLDNITSDKELLKDNELKDMAKEELIELEGKKEEYSQCINSSR